MVLDALDNSRLDYQLIGDPNFCVDSTINVAIKGVVSEALMLSTKQYCGVSNGSACTSKNYSPSYVLKAMGISDEIINSSIRISWGMGTDFDEAMVNIRELLNTAYNMIH